MRAYDFRGGKATELSPAQMEESMVLLGTNWYYDERLRKRPGWANLSVDTTINGATIRGLCNAEMNSTQYRIVALDDGSNVNFYYGDTGSYTAVDNTFDWTTAKNVEMVAFPLGNGDEIVIAVNGTDKPAVIYYSGGFIVKTLEAYDARTIDTDLWVAGLWDESETPDMVDDTTDAQSSTVDDFVIATATNNDGFYVAATQPFTKVVITNCPDLGTAVVAEIRYYAGAGVWTNLTVTTEPSWVAAEGDKTLEFDLPLDSDGVVAWTRYGDLASQTLPANVLNKYILRVRFTTADQAGSADYLTVSNTQYLTQLFLGVNPQAVAIHSNRLWLATENALRWAPADQVTGWWSQDVGGCPQGGDEILQLISGEGELIIAKPSSIYFCQGTTTDNFVFTSIKTIGVQGKRGADMVGGVMVYVATDGIRALMGRKSVRVSRHLTLSSLTKTDAVVIEWHGNAVISFPTDAVMLWADPDTVRTDDMGDGRVSLWNWAGMAASQMVVGDGGGDNGYLMVADNTGGRIAYASTNGYDTAFDTTKSPIACTLQTRRFIEGTPGQRKARRRVAVDVSRDGAWVLTISADGGDRTASLVIASGSGTGHKVFSFDLPYTMDGYDLSYKLENTTSEDIQIYGFTDETEEREL